MLDQVVERSTGGRHRDERGSGVHEPPSATDERFANYDQVVTFFVFLLGIGNFALHQAVLKSRHPLLDQLGWFIDRFGGRASLALEFALLLAALALAAGGHLVWAWAYTRLHCAQRARGLADPLAADLTGTVPAGARCRGMGGERAIWLVTNASSGSNDDAALAALDACCGEHGLRIAHRTTFPAQDLPTRDVLDAAGIDRVAVFAGDGTINGVIETLAGWRGAVLVLPGGTMNLLYHRLHGERPLAEVVAAVARGATALRRPGVIRCPFGTAYAGLLAGPGTSWGRVREAMREAAVVELAGSTVEAIDQTLTGEMIRCAEPLLGRREGYPLVCLEPGDAAIAIVAYHAESAAEYLAQAWALLRRNFREGPREVLGEAQKVRLASTRGHPFGLLIDGEQADATPEVEFVLAACEVDLVATGHDGS